MDTARSSPFTLRAKAAFYDLDKEERPNYLALGRSSMLSSISHAPLLLFLAEMRISTSSITLIKENDLQPFAAAISVSSWLLLFLMLGSNGSSTV
jgi:hypothetical protein